VKTHEHRFAIQALFFVTLLGAPSCALLRKEAPFSPPSDAERVWVGPETWANRLQDWRVREGRIECVDVSLPMRTLHRTTRRVEPGEGSLMTSVRLGVLEAVPKATQAKRLPSAGILIGAGASDLDWRAAALVQSAPGPHGGYYCGVDAEGRLFLRDFSDAKAEPVLSRQRIEVTVVDLRVELFELRDGPALGVVALDPTGAELARVTSALADREALTGSIALACDAAPFWFDDWRIEGTRVGKYSERTIGSLIGVQHTLSRGVMKMTAQLLPTGAGDDKTVRLEVREQGKWREVAREAIVTPGWTAHFRVEDWTYPYDVAYRLTHGYVGGQSTLRGSVPHDPLEKDEVVLAALSCNHNNKFGFGRAGYPWNDQALWYPHGDLIEKVAAHDPDLLFFAGDQLYEGVSPTRAEKKRAPELDYLYKWALWCVAYVELTRDRPSITIPDDHDVYQGNLWGAGGPHAKRDNEGGYVMPAEWVKMVERTQTSHLPDPFDPTPVEQGIGVYYTDLSVGEVSFAILEDRKFKSGCADLDLGGPRPDHITDASIDVRRADRADKKLLGERQLQFLDTWARDWQGVKMKAVLSQSPFAALATHHGSRQDYLHADLDSNGWPQSGRNRALAALRKCFAIQVAGDQHLATLVRHGIDDWDDATWSFTMPAIANFYARSWRPEGEPEVALEGGGEFTGSRYDGFMNKVTVHAVANPRPTGLQPAALHDQVPGYGIVRYRKPSRECVIECWPRSADPASDPQYEGWPRTIAWSECYEPKQAITLAEVRLPGVDEPIIEVLDDTGALLYALRSPKPTFQPWVPGPGTYVVRLRDQDGRAEEKVVEVAEARD